MVPCWPIRATLGLLVCACFIGGHVFDLIIADLFSLIIEEQPQCMINFIVDFDGTWSWYLTCCAWTGICMAIVLYVLYLMWMQTLYKQPYHCWFVVVTGIYIALLIANGLIAVWLVGSYANNYWFNDFCETQKDLSYVYGLLAGSYILPAAGICAFAWSYVAVS